MIFNTLEMSFSKEFKRCEKKPLCPHHFHEDASLRSSTHCQPVTSDLVNERPINKRSNDSLCIACVFVVV
ncbi:hypothetical protein V1477_016711 [Vespula maculifrons]|uniref:THAP-type domain-containing protein n=1 Tax=Vespula maculifrons TaxID=7453 RepID=A0ABD2B403_VESMC